MARIRVSKIERVHTDFSRELEKMWNGCGREVTKVNLTKQIARQLKEKNRRKPRYQINYWPLSNKVENVY